MATKQEEIIKAFCDRYEGRESEIGCKPIVYGDMQMIADELRISIQDVAVALISELDQLEEK